MELLVLVASFVPKFMTARKRGGVVADRGSARPGDPHACGALGAHPPLEGEGRERSERGGVNAKRALRFHPTPTASLRFSGRPSHSRGGRRAAPSSLKSLHPAAERLHSQRYAGPCSLPSARGSPVVPSVFPSPERGEWRAEATRDLDYSQILPDCSGVTRGLRVRRTVPVRLAVRRATRHYRFRVHGQSDRARGLCATGRLPECRPGTGLAFATLAGAASRPTFTTPRDDAPRWTGCQ